MKARFPILFLGALLCVAGVRGLRTSTLVVSSTADSGTGSLRAALAGASDGDTINFSVTGTITLTGGELLVNKNVTITGPGSADLAVDGHAASTVFHIAAGKTVGISGLTVTNAGDVAIHNDGGTLTLANCVISGNVNNATNFGGGVYNDGAAGSATLHVSHCAISNNDGIFGGGISNDGSVGGATFDIDTCVISNNLASFGGGVYNDGPFGGTRSIANSVLDHNLANDSGGIFNRDASLEISNSTLSNNQSDANDFAGAIQNHGGRSGSLASVTLTNSTVKHSVATFNHDGVIENVKESSSAGATMLISHCTFSGDTYVLYNLQCTTLEIGHTIFNNMFAISNQAGAVISDGYNITSGGGVMNGLPSGCVSTGDLNATGDLINTDPKLDPGGLQDNGGPTATIGLQPGSPAIDAGDPNFAPPPLYDQRGPGFPRVANNRIDVGAFEVQAAPTATPTPTATSTPALTPTNTPTSTPSVNPTSTPTNTATSTPTPTSTPVSNSFFTVAPCRVADTRNAPGPSGGPALAANTVRTFPVSNICGIPASARAVAINLAVFLPSDGGDLRVYPAGGAAPLASAINFRAGIVRANNAVVPLGAGGQLSVQCDMPAGGTDFFFDISGYFQ
jgi:hypothetical protein